MLTPKDETAARVSGRRVLWLAGQRERGPGSPRREVSRQSGAVPKASGGVSRYFASEGSNDVPLVQMGKLRLSGHAAFSKSNGWKSSLIWKMDL